MTDRDGPRVYKDGRALLDAATARVKTTTAATGEDRAGLMRRFVFDRFLARVFAHPTSPWVLKGGSAVLARVHDARTTKDLDLLHQLADIDAAIDALRLVAATDLGDHFRFVITGVDKGVGGMAQPNVDGARVNIDTYVGTRRYSAASTKLCAIQALYGDDQRPSSRYRDLVDLVVFALTEDIDGAELTAAIFGEWAHRSMAGAPRFDPPAEFERAYPPLARRVPRCAGYATYADAAALVAAMLAPALADTAAGRRWDPTAATWRPAAR